MKSVVVAVTCFTFSLLVRDPKRAVVVTTRLPLAAVVPTVAAAVFVVAVSLAPVVFSVLLVAKVMKLLLSTTAVIDLDLA